MFFIIKNVHIKNIKRICLHKKYKEKPERRGGGGRWGVGSPPLENTFFFVSGGSNVFQVRHLVFNDLIEIN